MAQRLPVPGQDNDTWGNILNGYLSVSLAGDGTLAPGSVGTAQIASGAVTATQLQDGSITDAKVSGTAAIAKTKLSPGVQTSLSTADTSVQQVNSKTPVNGAVTLTAGDVGAMSQTTADSRYAPVSGSNNYMQVAAQSLSATQKSQVRSNVGLGGLTTAWNSVMREHRNERRLGALCTTASVTNDTTNDPTLSSYYLQPGYTNGTPARPLTTAEVAALKFDPGQDFDHMGVLSAGIGWTYFSTPVYAAAAYRRMRISTDAPKLQVACWMFQSGMPYEVLVNDQPVTSGPQTFASTISYMHIDLSAMPGRSNVVEIRTAAAIGSIQTAPPYSIWRPSPERGPQGLIVGDSYLTSCWGADGSSIPPNLGNLLMHGITDYLDVEHALVDGIGGTGFITRNASGSGAPNNNYTDRVLPYLSRANPDFILIPNGCANDLGLGQTACTNAIVSWLQTARTTCPTARIIYAYGHVPTSFQVNLSLIRAIGDAVRTAMAADGNMYFYDNTGWLFGNGYITGGTKMGSASSNGQIYIGNDQLHPTIPGTSFLRPRHSQVVGRILRDDGRLAGQLISAG